MPVAFALVASVMGVGSAVILWPVAGWLSLIVVPILASAAAFGAALLVAARRPPASSADERIPPSGYDVGSTCAPEERAETDTASDAPERRAAGRP